MEEIEEIIIFEGDKPKKAENNSKKKTIDLTANRKEKKNGTTVDNKA